jgi:hypothetical protein
MTSKHEKQNKSQNQSNKKNTSFSQQKTNLAIPTVIKLDSRTYSQKAYDAMNKMITQENDDYFIAEKYHKKASSLVRNLPSYISTWGLHRLSGDASNFLAKKTEDTKYKGKVYRKFLQNLKSFEVADFKIENEGSLLGLPLREYTGLNRLAIKLAKE